MWTAPGDRSSAIKQKVVLITIFLPVISFLASTVILPFMRFFSC